MAIIFKRFRTGDSLHKAVNQQTFDTIFNVLEELAPVYERIGTFMNEKCGGYTGGLITGNPDLARLVNLYYRTRIPFFNGPIDCRLFVYPGCELKGQNVK